MKCRAVNCAANAVAWRQFCALCQSYNDLFHRAVGLPVESAAEEKQRSDDRAAVLSALKARHANEAKARALRIKESQRIADEERTEATRARAAATRLKRSADVRKTLLVSRMRLIAERATWLCLKWDERMERAAHTTRPLGRRARRLPSLEEQERRLWG